VQHTQGRRWQRSAVAAAGQLLVKTIARFLVDQYRTAAVHAITGSKELCCLPRSSFQFCFHKSKELYFICAVCHVCWCSVTVWQLHHLCLPCNLLDFLCSRVAEAEARTRHVQCDERLFYASTCTTLHIYKMLARSCNRYW
jgi:hypothetical protein